MECKHADSPAKKKVQGAAVGKESHVDSWDTKRPMITDFLEEDATVNLLLPTS